LSLSSCSGPIWLLGVLPPVDTPPVPANDELPPCAGC
jgi:hypothetical protein